MLWATLKIQRWWKYRNCMYQGIYCEGPFSKKDNTGRCFTCRSEDKYKEDYYNYYGKDYYQQ